MRFRRMMVCLILCFTCVLNGCSRAPQMSSSNFRTLQALQTAVSSQRTDWLDAVVTEIVQKREKKEMTDREFKAVDAIVKKAKSGDWKSALKDAFRLSESQRPVS